MPDNNQKENHWENKLDEQVKSVNAMLMGLSGGLLAFAANYVFGESVQLPALDRIFTAIAVIGASVSLCAGAARSWLRISLYNDECTKLELKRNKTVEKKLNKLHEEYDERIKSGADELLKSRRELSDEQLEKAMADYFLNNPDSEGLKSLLLLHEGDLVLSRLELKNKLKIMESMEPLQFISFVVRACSIAILVLTKLA